MYSSIARLDNRTGQLVVTVQYLACFQSNDDHFSEVGACFNRHSEHTNVVDVERVKVFEH